MGHIYNRQQLIGFLKKWANEHDGLSPIKDDFKNNSGYPSYSTYIREYGTWNSSLIDAGLNCNTKEWTEQEIIESIRKLSIKLQKTPLETDFINNIGYPSVNIIRKKFRSYNEAVRRSGLNVNKDFEKTVEQRFWEKVDKNCSLIKYGGNRCWEWTGAKGSDGYGHFYDGNKVIGAHRFAYIIVHGSIPKDEEVCHMCDNMTCVNEAHMFLGSQSDNIKDMDLKGRRYSKLNEKEVDEIREKYKNMKVETYQDKVEAYRVLAEDYGIMKHHVGRIVRNEIWIDKNIKSTEINSFQKGLEDYI